VPPPAKPVDKKALPVPPAAKQEHPAPVASADHAAADAKKKVTAPAGAAPAPAKPVVAAKPTAVAKPSVTAEARHAPVHEPSAAEEGNWSVLVGTYVLEESLSADMSRVRKAGLVPVVKNAARKKSQMNRLLLSEFSDRAAARAAFEKLKAHTSDAFILEKGGRYAVYAGSYLLTERVASEKERLQAEGFPVTLQHSDVSIPAQSLTVGPFIGKKAASAAVKTLKGAGIKASLIRQ
jgi:cell division septation protein DedD